MSPTEPTAANARITNAVTTNPGHDDPLPLWANVFGNPGVARSFVSVVSDIVEQRWGPDATFDRSRGQATLLDGRLINFANAACELIGFDEPYWRRYLFSMLSEFDSFDPAELERELRSWSQVRGRLRVRLFPTDGDDPIDESWELLQRPVSASMSFIVAADAEIGCVPITADVFDHWDTPVDQVWQTAIENTGTQVEYRIAMARTPMTGFIMIEGDLYTTGLARDLTGILGAESDGLFQHGALIAAPTSRSLFIQPIIDPKLVLDDTVGLISAAAQFQHSEPGAMGCDIFWYRGVDNLLGAVEFGPGGSIRTTAPEPLATWLGNELAERPDMR